MTQKNLNIEQNKQGKIIYLAKKYPQKFKKINPYEANKLNSNDENCSIEIYDAIIADIVTELFYVVLKRLGK